MVADRTMEDTLRPPDPAPAELHIALIADSHDTYSRLKQHVRVIQPIGWEGKIHLHVLLDNPKKPISDSNWAVIQYAADIFDIKPNPTIAPPEQISLGYKR